MRKLAMPGWNPVLRKVLFTKLLQSSLGYSLSEAESITDAVLDQTRVRLEMQDKDCAGLLPLRNKLGARALLQD